MAEDMVGLTRIDLYRGGRGLYGGEGKREWWKTPSVRMR